MCTALCSRLILYIFYQSTVILYTPDGWRECRSQWFCFWLLRWKTRVWNLSGVHVFFNLDAKEFTLVINWTSSTLLTCFFIYATKLHKHLKTRCPQRLYHDDTNTLKIKVYRQHNWLIVCGLYFYNYDCFAWVNYVIFLLYLFNTPKCFSRTEEGCSHAWVESPTF